MRVFYTDHFVLPLPDGHRFPMQKYSLLREAVQAYASHSLEEAPAAHDEQLLLVHDAAYIERMSNGGLSATEIRQIGFPWSAPMAERARRSAGATIVAATAALHERCAINLAGGTHHAFADHGEGFCCYNDAAVAARVLQRDHDLQRVLICDLDVHQGNGTASIFRDDDSVFTFSMHGARNYPVRKETSDLDLELLDGCDDATYLAALHTHLPQIIHRFQPQAMIYLAGADPYEGDRLGRLKLTKAGLAARDRFVLELARDNAVAVAVTMAGGYAHDVADIVDIHFNTVRTAFEVFA
ncbi:MAG: histone deacetylase [Rhizobacter sp.]|nr:histone deacetylase [Burkholderiales bacterium]